MVLRIKGLEDSYTLEGELSKTTVPEFHKTFKTAFRNSDKLTIDIFLLNRIDRYGVNALAKLHNEALLVGKTLRITGMNNSELFRHFKEIDAA